MYPPCQARQPRRSAPHAARHGCAKGGRCGTNAARRPRWGKRQCPTIPSSCPQPRRPVPRLKAAGSARSMGTGTAGLSLKLRRRARGENGLTNGNTDSVKSASDKKRAVGFQVAGQRGRLVSARHLAARLPRRHLLAKRLRARKVVFLRMPLRPRR